MPEQKQEKPLMVVAGRDCFYLQAASGEYVAKVISDSVTAKLQIEHICKAVNEYSALCAVEQAAKDFERMHSDQVFICSREDEEMVEYNLANLVECLAALAKLRS